MISITRIFTFALFLIATVMGDGIPTLYECDGACDWFKDIGYLTDRYIMFFWKPAMKYMELPLIRLSCELFSDNASTCETQAENYFDTVYKGGKTTGSV